MFINLIESDSHRQELKRRSSFFLATVAAYALILFVAGIVSIYAYDARLEAQTSSLELLNWVPPIVPGPTHVPPEMPRQPVRRTQPSTAPVDGSITIAERRNGIARTDDPSRVPEHPSATPATDPPVTGIFRLSNRNVDPPSAPVSSGCVTCTGVDTGVRVSETTKPPDPPIVKPKTETLPTQVLISHAISLPQPPYPPLARQIHLQGSVPVQILVDESGRVISAHALSGHAFLTRAAEEAALRARFTTTTYNGQPVKVLGVITYNFVLQ
jgi:TonB family protein